MPSLTPDNILWILTIAIWIDGLWLIKLIINKPALKSNSCQTIEGKAKVEPDRPFNELNYHDPFDPKL